MEDESSEYNYEQLRNMSVAERQERFRAFKKARVMSEVKKSTEVDHWQSIDDPMTSEQLDRLPPGHPDVDPQTPPVWVKLFHPWHREVMVSKGRFNYESGTWAARFQPKEEGNCSGRGHSIRLGRNRGRRAAMGWAGDSGPCATKARLTPVTIRTSHQNGVSRSRCRKTSHY